METLADPFNLGLKSMDWQYKQGYSATPSISSSESIEVILEVPDEYNYKNIKETK